MSKVRRWHAWSVWKTQVLLRGYLPAFTKACQGARHRSFLDCFAGDADTVDMAGNPFEGSPRVALRTNPPLTHAVFFELPDKAPSLEAALREEFPDRTFHVVGGDCNWHVGDGLAWFRDQGSATSGPHLGPIFALLDPDSMELSWSTVETIANWTGQEKSTDYKRRRNVEILILFPTGPFRRTMPIAPGTTEASDSAKADADRLFGNNKWREIYAAQRLGVIDGEDSWMHYVDLYRLGLLSLGYTYTSVIEVKNTSNAVLYHLVFATASNIGKKIMRDVQKRARAILPAMVENEKRTRRVSGPRLFEESDDDLDRYANEPEKWAWFTDDDPRPFDPANHPPPRPREGPPTLF